MTSRRKTGPIPYKIPTAWDSAIANYLDYETVKGTSKNTLIKRREHLRRIAREIFNPSPHAVTPTQILQWLAGQTWARETRRSWTSTLKSFYKFLDRPEIIEVLPSVKASPPAPRPIPEQMLATALKTADPRAKLILLIAATAGLRRAEIAQIHAKDLTRDLTGWSLLVHGKGDKQRIVPLPDSLAATIRLQAGGSWLLPSSAGGHLSPGRVGYIASRVLPDGWTLHTLRHRFATITHDATSDLLAISQLLGHASVATTQRYIATGRDRLRMVAGTAKLVA